MECAFLLSLSKTTRRNLYTGSVDLCVFQNSALLQSGSQTNQKTKRFNPKLFLAEPSEFLEKNHAEFCQDSKKLFQSDENSREIPTAKPRDTFHLSSASLRPYFCDDSLQVLISNKYP